MPLEIRELIIKVAVDAPSNKKTKELNSPLVKSELVKECVEKVLHQLKLKSQR